MIRRYLQPSWLVTVALLIPATDGLQPEPRPNLAASPVAPTQQRSSAASPLDTAADAAKRWTAGAALAATLAAGTWTLPASAVDVSTKTIQVEVDAPVLLKRLRGEKYQTELLDALRELQDVVGPDAIKVTPPSNVRGAFRDLLSGKGEVTVNGQPVDVALLSSEKGEVTVRISNSLLPKVPVLSAGTNIPFLSSGGDGAVTTASAPDFETPDLWTVLDTLWSVFGPDEDVTIGALLNVLGRAYGWDMTTPFPDQKFFGGAVGIPIPRAQDKGGPFTFIPTNKDVVGGSSLTLGAVYAAAYAYHNSMIENEENLAAERKKERAEKSKAAAAAKAAKEKAEAEKRKTEEEEESRKAAEEAEAAMKKAATKKAADDMAAEAKAKEKAAAKVIDEPPQLVRVDERKSGAGQVEKKKRSRLRQLLRRGD